MTRGKTNGNYEVGFAKTPVYTRFKSGQSGNPGGRPKKKGREVVNEAPALSEFDDALRAELDRTITINEGGKPRKVKMRDLVPRAQINAAVKGNPLAQQHVMKAMRELEQRDAERAAALAEDEKAKREEDDRLYLHMARKKEKRAQVWAEAQGREPDQPWPHPDDILLFPDTRRWHIRGPFDQSGVTLFKWYRARRDYLFAYTALKRRAKTKSARAFEQIYTVLWVSFDMLLPDRWQLARKPEEAEAYLSLDTPTIKQLQAEIDKRQDDANFFKALAGVGDGHDKDTYKIVNRIMKPLLNHQGYRSLAELEHAIAKGT
jgi:hypothetical protein